VGPNRIEGLNFRALFPRQQICTQKKLNSNLFPAMQSQGLAVESSVSRQIDLGNQ
jgi:hypothetical protein